MIVDWNGDVEHAIQYEIVDGVTGDILPSNDINDSIYYADDVKGVIRRYIQDREGNYMLALKSNPHVPLENPPEWKQFIRGEDGIMHCVNDVCLAWVEENKSIRLVRKDELSNG